MKSTHQTPTVVLEALRTYHRTQIHVRVRTCLAAGLAVAALLVCLLFLADRFFEVPPFWRTLGKWAVFASLAVGGISALAAAIFSRIDPRKIAIRLDQAYPENRDRWATSLDLADQLAQGKSVGDAACVDRLFSETQTLTTGRPVAEQISRRPLRLVLLVGVALLAGLAALHLAGLWDVPLLAARLWNPAANLPRDSATQIRLVSVNGQPVSDQEFAALPEDSPLEILVEVTRRKTLFDRLGWTQPATTLRLNDVPRMEGSSADEANEFTQVGNQWRWSTPRLTEPLTFRVRAGDGLSRSYQQDTIPRIRLENLTYNIRFPKYSRLENVEKQPLEGQRISVLAGSRLDFDAQFNLSYESIDATFEVLTKGRSAKDPQTSDAPTPAAGSRQKLNVRKMGSTAARFGLIVEESGVLRISALGANGLPSQELLCLIEARPDQPPRIFVVGLEENTTIAPGETLALDYQAEDDFAVSEVTMEWNLAGSSSPESLRGADSLAAKGLGEKTATGQELIQRMNYQVYANNPFEFTLVALDSKGQEARSAVYRIFLQEDSFLSRVERGMGIFERNFNDAQAYSNEITRMENSLKIVSAAVGQNLTWPANQDNLLKDLEQSILNLRHPHSTLDFYLLSLGGIPARMHESGVLLLSALQTLPSRASLFSSLRNVKTANDLPVALENLRSQLAEAKRLAGILSAAASAEKARFLPELALQKALQISARLQALFDQPTSQAVDEANLKLYLDQLGTLTESLKTLVPVLPELAPHVDHLQTVKGDGKAAIQALTALVPVLATHAPAPSPESQQLAATLAAANQTELAPQVRGALASVERARGQEDILRPFDITAFPDPVGNTVLPTTWDKRPIGSADLWLVLSQLAEDFAASRGDEISQRFQRYPQARQDRRSELREAVLFLRDSTVLTPEQQTVSDLLIAEAAGCLADLPPESAGPLHEAASRIGRQPFNETAESGEATMGLLPASLREIATGYENQAIAIDAYLSGPASDEGRIAMAETSFRLQQRLAATEARYRAANFIRTLHQLLASTGAPQEWEKWKPFQGLQLALTLACSMAEERVFSSLLHPPEQIEKHPPHYQSTAKWSRELATNLRTYADLLEAAVAGRPAEFDFEEFMKSTRTSGALEAVQSVLDEVTPLLAPTGGTQSVNPKILESQLGQIARLEWQLAREAHPNPDTDALQLPRQNRESANARTPRGPANIWTISGVVSAFEARWVNRMQNARLSLIRLMLDRTIESPSAEESRQRLAVQTARLLEMQARNVGVERRANSGLALFQGGEDRPSKLPKHIAEEFRRARAKKSPEIFKQRIEDYYEDLQKNFLP